MPTALLICMENTFWRISHGGDSNFVELFKISFTFYVESGMRSKVEADIEMLRNQSGCLVADEFKAKFCKIIIDNLLRKFHCFFALDTSNHFLCLNIYSTPCF
jgi:hypothetical protein